MNAVRLARIGLAGAALSLLVLAAPSARLVEPGEDPIPAFDFELVDINPQSPGFGDKVRLSDVYDGQGLVLNFMASWCMPCREEIPRLQAVQEAEMARVLCVAADEYGGPEGLEPIFDSMDMTMPVLYAPEETAAAIAKHYDYTFLPATYFIDSAGDVVSRFEGLIPEETLLREIRERLGEPAGR
jgi:thiol-disulfide isomerase/thioredoxin